jgi:hypothetical protein
MEHLWHGMVCDHIMAPIDPALEFLQIIPDPSEKIWGLGNRSLDQIMFRWMIFWPWDHRDKWYAKSPSTKSWETVRDLHDDLRVYLCGYHWNVGIKWSGRIIVIHMVMSLEWSLGYEESCPNDRKFQLFSSWSGLVAANSSLSEWFFGGGHWGYPIAGRFISWKILNKNGW